LDLTRQKLLPQKMSFLKRRKNQAQLPTLKAAKQLEQPYNKTNRPKTRSNINSPSTQSGTAKK
jgi:hypothetical protein